MRNFFFLVTLVIIMSGLIIPGQSFAKSAKKFPSRNLNILVPYSAGGSTDLQARLIADLIQQDMGRRVNVVDKPGGGGSIGMNEARRAKADGHTIILTAAGPSTVTPIRTNAGYNTTKDYEYIGQLSSVQYALAVNTNSGIDSFDQWKDAAAKDPQKWHYSTPGAGLHIHLLMVNLLERMGMDLKHIPFNGAAEAMTQLIGGHIGATMVSLPDAITHHRSGTIKIIAIASQERISQLPEVPTLKELGYNLSPGGWFGFLAPKGTPAEVIEKWRSAIGKALKVPQLLDFYKKMGMTITWTTPGQLKEKIETEYEAHTKILKEMKL